MKRLIILILGITVFNVIYSQEGFLTDIDKAIINVNDEITSIDNLICYKALYDDDGFRVGDEGDNPDRLVVLYYDKNKQLRKSKAIFNYPEGEYIYIYYFSKKKTAIKYYFYSISGMSNSFSILKYLNDDKSLLYIDFLRRDDDRGGIIIEHTQRSGGYNLKTPRPQISDVYEDISDIEGFTNDTKTAFYKEEVLDLSMPQEIDSVGFIKARVGDKTIINRNYVHLYKDSIGSHTPLIDLHVGYKVLIVESNGKWSKVKYEKWGYDAADKYVPFDYVGYIETKYIAPVEICIQKGIEK